MTGILEGVKVISMGAWLAVPSASVYLGEWGADVIKLEPLIGDHMRGTTRTAGMRTSVVIGGVEVNPLFQTVNRNQRGIAVDLKKEAGRDILYQLIKEYDVFITNYQVAALKGLKMDYATLSQINPKLIYGVITGYGSKGPDRDEAALDEVVGWARSGFQYLTSEPDGPPARNPGPIGDIVAGIHLITGVLAALLHREKTGKGQELELALLHSAMWSITNPLLYALVGRPHLKPPRNQMINPLHIAYQAKDGRWLQLAMTQSDLYWPAFCRAIERPELENDPRFNSMLKREENREELTRILDKVFASRTIDEWDERCRAEHLIYTRIKTLEEAAVDPQALANDFFGEVQLASGPMKVLTSPVKFHQNPTSVKCPAPELGQHTEEILLELGYDWEKIGQLKEQQVIL